MRKKVFAAVLCGLLGAAALTGCANSQNAGNTDTGKTAGKSTEASSAEASASGSASSDSSEGQASGNEAAAFEDVSIEEVTVLDQDGIKVTLNELNPNGDLGVEIAVTVSNDTENAVTIMGENVSINGLMISASFLSTLDAGESKNDTWYYVGNELEKAGIDTIRSMEMKVRAVDSESYAEVAASDIVTVDTSASDGTEQAFNAEGREIFNKEGFRIVAQDIDTENSLWGADVYFFIENNFGKDVSVLGDDITVNDVSLGSLLGSSVAKDKKAIAVLSLSDSDLESNGIEDIEKITMSLDVVDTETYEYLADSETVTIDYTK